MRIDIKVPPLPESVSDATLLTWYRQPGDAVERDEKLVDLETDKVVLEVPAPRSGVLGELLAHPGDTVEADQALSYLETQPADTAKSGTAGIAQESAAPPAATPVTAEQEPAPAAVPGTPPAMGPAVRRLLEEHGLDPARIPASGPRGRLTKTDVLAYLSTPEAAATQPETREGPPETGAAAPEAPALAAAQVPVAAPSEAAGELPSPLSGPRPEQRVPMTRLRRRVAERLVEAQRTAAILTTFNEVDMQAVMGLRSRYREGFEKEHGVRLGFMSFFVKACVQALGRFPNLNASVEGDDIVYHGYYDIGIAVSSPRGLVVPILRDADALSFAEVEKGIAELAGRAREAKLQVEDLTGGTFSITNGGIFGSLLSTPILNPPQSAILGMHKIQPRPVAVDGEVVVKPIMYLALSYDHRIIDGAEAVRFLVTVKEALEDPARLLLEI